MSFNASIAEGLVDSGLITTKNLVLQGQYGGWPQAKKMYIYGGIGIALIAIASYAVYDHQKKKKETKWLRFKRKWPCSLVCKCADALFRELHVMTGEQNGASQSQITSLVFVQNQR